MKSSFYNIYKKIGDKYVLLNTLAGAAAHIDEEIKDLLEENPDKIPEDILKMLRENGFVVEDNCNEKKILAYEFDKDKYNVIPYGLVYTVAVTYGCNLACPYCYEGTKKDTETLDNKRIDTLLKNIDKNFGKRDFKVLGITLYGGEPLIAYQQCVRLMEGASQICNGQNKEFKGEMLTNGVLINEKVVNDLLEPYCSTIQITMDGGKEAHNKRRPYKDGRGTYDHLLDVLELLRDSTVNFTLKLNIDRENVDTFGDLSQDLKERGLETITKTFGQIFPPGSERASEGCAGYTEKCFTADEAQDFMKRIYEQLGEPKSSQKSLTIPRYSHCAIDREDIYVVDPYLDVYICWKFLGMKDKKVGCINKDGDMIFNYEYYEQMSRNPFEFENCTDCKYLPVCGGGCAAQAYFENGTYHSSPCKKYKYLQKYWERYLDNIMEEMA